MTPTLRKLFSYHGVKPIPLGPRTPWPNRAEAAVRLVKGHLAKLGASVDAEPTLSKVTAKRILRKAAEARNTTVTFGGKTPVEIAYGRRPPDVIDVETADPEQISSELDKHELSEIQLQKIAQKTYQEARQADDIRRDLSRSLRPTSGPFKVGDHIYFWIQTMGTANKGYWERGVIVEDLGTMVDIDTGTTTMRVNKTLVRARGTDWSDIPDLETVDAATLAQPWMYNGTTETDISELYSGTYQLSAACAANGLSVANPQNLRTHLPRVPFGEPLNTTTEGAPGVPTRDY